ncbi:hypothetical protein DFH06DRAFT_1212752 [Mycena polygramma]|nr:hypothetical protein DFH06DRAFT_1212752 [Mycena polygramma]
MRFLQLTVLALLNVVLSNAETHQVIIVNNCAMGETYSAISEPVPPGSNSTKNLEGPGQDQVDYYNGDVWYGSISYFLNATGGYTRMQESSGQYIAKFTAIWIGGCGNATHACYSYEYECFNEPNSCNATNLGVRIEFCYGF